MNKIKTTLFKIGVYAYIHLKALIRKRCKEKTGNILFIISGGLGDALLDAQAFEALVDRYVSEGEKVSIVSNPVVCSILQMLPGMSEVCFIPYAFPSAKNFDREMLKSLRMTIGILRAAQYEHIILKLNRNNLWARCIAGSLSAGCFTAALYDSDLQRFKKRLTCFSLQHTVDKYISFSDDLTQMQKSKEFAKMLGAADYQISITYLPKQYDYRLTKDPYITVAIDSSRPEKRWPTEYFIELVQRLLNQYDYDIVLTGSILSEETLNQYETAFQDEDRIIILIGKTDLPKWIELIRGARFHIGVDSGSIHIAASVGTQAFCLAGAWDKRRFLPYQVEANTPGTAAPICIYRSDIDVDSLFCANCNVRGNFGWGNRECHTKCKNGQPCLCLSKITPDHVMDTIQHAMGTER